MFISRAFPLFFILILLTACAEDPVEVGTYSIVDPGPVSPESESVALASPAPTKSKSQKTKPDLKALPKKEAPKPIPLSKEEAFELLEAASVGSQEAAETLKAVAESGTKIPITDESEALLVDFTYNLTLIVQSYSLDDFISRSEECAVQADALVTVIKSGTPISNSNLQLDLCQGFIYSTTPDFPQTEALQKLQKIHLSLLSLKMLLRSVNPFGDPSKKEDIKPILPIFKSLLLELSQNAVIDPEVFKMLRDAHELSGNEEAANLVNELEANQDKLKARIRAALHNLGRLLTP